MRKTSSARFSVISTLLLTPRRRSSRRLLVETLETMAISTAECVWYTIQLGLGAVESLQHSRVPMGVNVAIPDFQTIMLPLLKIASDGQEHSIREAREALSAEFKLSEEEKRRSFQVDGKRFSIIGSRGQRPIYSKPRCWKLRRGYFRISERGHSMLVKGPSRVAIKDLEQFPEFLQFRATTRDHKAAEPSIAESGQTPEEMLELAYQKLREDMVTDLVGRAKRCSPQFFEQLVLEVLLKMGYGDRAKRLGRQLAQVAMKG